MRVRFFPHTHVSDATSDVLRRLFDEVAVIVPSNEDPVPEGLTALVPTPDETEKFKGLLAVWRQFGGLHQEALVTYALGRGRRVEPLDDLLTSQIKSELQRQVKGGAKVDPEADPLTVARALLSLAAEYDLRHRELNLDLARIDKKQQDLLGDLKGEVPDFPEQAVLGDEGGDVRMLKRLSAWATLFVGEAAACPDCVFVTESREALELVEEYGAPLEELGRFRGEQLGSGFLENILGGDGVAQRGTVAPDGTVTVRIFITRREHPYNVFNKFISGTNVFSANYTAQPSEINGNVLFLLLEGITPRQ
ncbi:hypothetical protein [Desulfoluna sp.]|uniref:hypothetical protein n=1 Tax=Desulfoluna sp. TaxID=2045199 RepID=UPI0026106DDA|nr:hypothetical protein [Desulfoluna sp.]